MRRRVIDRIRDSFVMLMQRVPRIRGHGRASIAINRLFHLCGAQPFLTAQMSLGHRLILDSRVDSHIWAAFSGNYDDPYINTLARLIPKGGVVFDVGANIGFYTVPLAQASKLKGARVIAFEPFSENVARLRANLELNGLASIVDLYPVGLSDTNDNAILELREDFLKGGETGNAVIVRGDSMDNRWRRVRISVAPLDELWPTLGLDRIDIVKVDIEGHEVEFMKGAAKTLATFRPVIQLEVNRGHYQPRGIEIGAAFKSVVPVNYRFASLSKTGRLVSADLSTFIGDDVYAIPAERFDTIGLAEARPGA